MGTDGLIMPTKTPKVRPENPLSDSNGGLSEVRPQMPPDSPEEVSSPPCESNFELLFSTNPVAMYVCDRETLEVLEVNPTAEQQYGYTREEFLKMKITDIRPAEDIPRLMEVARTSGQPLAFLGQWRHRRRNGQVFEVEVTAQGTTFAGRPAVLVVAQDISVRRAMEEKTAERTAYAQALTENNPTAIVAVNMERQVEMCNPAFERLFGYSLAEIRGAELDSLIAPRGLHDEMVGLIVRAASGDIVRATTKRKRKDGSLVDVQIIGVPLIVGGKRTGTFGMYEDITEKKHAEEALQRAEEKHRRIFDNAIEGFFESTPAGHFLAVNPAMARIAGYASPAEMISEIHDIGRQLYADPSLRIEVKRVLEERGILEEFECPMLRKDGSKIWISLNVRAVRDADGKIVSHDGTAEDITARKRSQLERQVNTEIIHAVSATDNLDDLLRLIHGALKQVLDAENCFVALHEASTGLFHYSFFVDQFDPPPPPDQMDRSCSAYVFRNARGMLIPREVFRDLARRGEVELVGTPSASWLGVPLRTPTETIGVLVVQNYSVENAYTERDLEFLSSVGDQIALAIERKRGEERVRQSEARLRVLIEQLPAVLWTVDSNLRFTSAVGAGLARLGLKPDQIVGMSLTDYFDTSDPTFVPIAAHRRAVGGEAVTFPVEWKDGSYACHVEPLRDGEGAVHGAICMALDVTDRKKLEEQFRQAQKMEAVGRLAGGIAHDFNNLLMVIQGYADLLAERLPEGEPLRRNAEQIRAASQRAAALTQQLLAFSRKQILAPKVLNVHAVVTDLEKILRRVIGEDIELRTSSAADLWLTKADRSQIEQVIMNLAVNARDAMPTGGTLTIETGNVEFDMSISNPPTVLAPGKYVMLAVTDNGCGMDEKVQAHIFEPFFTTKEKGKGTGLGLATVYGVVKQSGGYIWVYSEAGRGTTFKIYLPRIDEEDVPAARDRLLTEKATPRGSEVILLAEDEKGVRELAREYLETSGYTVIVAENGRTAIELASKHSGPIHLLMTDVVMPGMGGPEVAERIRALRPEIKVLFMSGYTDQAIMHQGVLQAGAVLLQKPFTLATLATKLREMLVGETIVQ